MNVTHLLVADLNIDEIRRGLLHAHHGYVLHGACKSNINWSTVLSVSNLLVIVLASVSLGLMSSLSVDFYTIFSAIVMQHTAIVRIFQSLALLELTMSHPSALRAFFTAC